MAQMTLKINKTAYESQIMMLQGYLGRLNSTLTQYETLRNNMDKFMDGKDDNYEKLRNGVETNIKTVRKAIEMCDSSIKMLQETLKDAEEFSGNVSQFIDNATETTTNIVKGAVEAIKLLS